MGKNGVGPPNLCILCMEIKSNANIIIVAGSRVVEGGVMLGRGSVWQELGINCSKGGGVMLGKGHVGQEVGVLKLPGHP